MLVMVLSSVVGASNTLYVYLHSIVHHILCLHYHVYYFVIVTAILCSVTLLTTTIDCLIRPTGYIKQIHLFQYTTASLNKCPLIEERVKVGN